MQDQIRQFLNYIQYEKRLSSHTLTAYKTDLAQCMDYLESTYCITQLPQAQFQMLRSWVVYLIELKDTSATINRKISCLKSFFRFAMRSEWVTLNPTAKLIRPKVPKRLPKDIEPNKLVALKDLLELQKDTSSYPAWRDYMMFMTFYCCGIRRNELQELTWDKFDLSQKQLKVFGKGKKERIVPLLPEWIELLKQYQLHIAQFQFELSKTYVFLNDTGEKLYPNFIYRTIKRYLQMLSTQQGLGPHSLRHSFATHLLNEGAALIAIKEMLGHASLASTQVYTHNSIEKLKKIHEFSHPKS